MADSEDSSVPRVVPIPDPSTLTTDALRSATLEWRRELAGTRELLESLIVANATRIEDASSERHEQIRALRELFEARLDGMDKAAVLVATEVSTYAARAVAMREEVSAVARSELTAVRELLETRFEGMDEATKLLALNVDKVPYAILQEAGNLKALLQGQIQGVEAVAAEKFTAIEGTFASNALALTAALAAQKEAAAEQNKSNTLAITKSEQATKETIAANAAQTATGQSSLSRELADLKERLVRLESGGVATKEAHGVTRADATFTQAERIAAGAQLRASISLVIGGIGGLVAIIAVIFALVHK